MDSNWTKTERGALFGFIVGLIGVAYSYFANKWFDLSFCFENFDPVFCVRYVSFLPFALALVGIFIGKIICLITKTKQRKRFIEEQSNNLDLVENGEKRQSNLAS